MVPWQGQNAENITGAEPSGRSGKRVWAITEGGSDTLRGGDSMDFLYDPLHASYRYDRIYDPGDWDRVGGDYGSLVVDGTKQFSTWAIDAGRAVFEADPCSCGVEGCGLLDVHAHRSGPFVVWTCWERRTDAPGDRYNLPLFFSAREYEKTLGGSIEGLPWLDGKHAARLLEGAPWIPADPQQESWWWWDHGPGEIEPAELAARLVALTIDDLAGATVVPLPEARWQASSDDGRALLVCEVDGALAVHGGELGRFPVALRIPKIGLP
jgi:hypothetical protein